MLKGMPSIPDFKGLVTSGTDALINFGGAVLINAIFGKRWGLVNEFGIPILLADSVVSLEYDNTSSISNVPIERGSFASYNKVDNPSNAVVQMSKFSGGTMKRGAFLAQLEALKNSTLKFHVISPEYVHRNMSIVGIDYARSAQAGMQLIIVNLHLEEVREVKVQYSTQEVANPSDSATVEGGDVQGTDGSGDTSILKKASKWIGL